MAQLFVIFQPWEFPRSGSKAIDMERMKERRRMKVNDYNGQKRKEKKRQKSASVKKKKF